MSGGHALRRTLLVLGVMSALLVTLGISAGTASAKGKDSSGYYVTLVARKCASYSDVFANRARNNIMESLQDLGPDTQYSDGDSINPAAEDEFPQSKCQPLKDWTFTMGPSYQTGGAVGAWGNLSKVTSPYDTSIVTKQEVPRLDSVGQPIAGEMLKGAANIELTEEQADRAHSYGTLWFQGGTPDDPVLANEFGTIHSPEYGFATLRCAVDYTNADNVEYVLFPNDTHHVYCYALYVTPPPTSGTIIVKKTVVGAPPGAAPQFQFNGSISYDPNGFQLAGGQSQQFVRGDSATSGDWDFTEAGLSDYKLSNIKCESGDGHSTFHTDLATHKTVVSLAAQDTVTCDYTNTYVPPAGLSVYSETHGGTGTFTFATEEVATGDVHHAAATTHEEGVPAQAGDSRTVAPGEYRITAKQAPYDTRDWELTEVSCGGKAKASPTVEVHVPVGGHVACTFVHRVLTHGSLVLSKTTLGGIGNIKFQIASGSDPELVFLQHARTVQQGVPAEAKPDTQADATDDLPLGDYSVAEQQPLVGDWAPETVTCNGLIEPFQLGRVNVALTKDSPDMRCNFVDLKVKKPPRPGAGNADLKITKTASSKKVIRGHNVTYTLTVHNFGPHSARNTVVVDQVLDHIPVVIHIHNPTGLGCLVNKVLACRLGTVKPGQTIKLKVVMSTDGWRGKIKNRAVVGSTTRDRNLKNNKAVAVIHVVAAPLPPIPVGEG